MTQTENARAGDAGAVKAWRLFTPKYSRDRLALQDSARIGSPRFERQIERLHRLGPRPTAELLIEIAIRTGESGFIADRVEAYAALDLGAVTFVGGDRFPPNVLGMVR